MNQLVYYGSATSIPYYNCSSYDSLESQDESHLILGLIDIIYGFIVIMLYLPTLVVFHQESKLACFKIMFSLGVMDVGAVFINSIVTGYLLIRGSSFCDLPNFIYITGAFGLSFWCGSCLTCLILALNRIVDMLFPLVVKMYFRGYRTCAVLMLPIFYAMYFFFFTTPIIFSAKHQTWFFDPLTMDDMNLYYSNIPHTINNFSLVFFTAILYFFFCCKVQSKTVITNQERKQRVRRKRSIFIQATLLCLFHLLASVIYVVMQFCTVPGWVTWLAQCLWQLAQGSPVLIYLTFNKKVRERFFYQLSETTPKFSQEIGMTARRIGTQLRTGPTESAVEAETRVLIRQTTLSTST